MSEIVEKRTAETGRIDVNSGKRAGVYDKKLLWRANLYIDEGANDWNNVNRWTAAQGNEWDTIGDGRQCTIQSWTQTSGVARHNTVGYTHYGKDSVANFNANMLAQQDALEAAGVALNPNGETLAPGNNWNNYIDYLNTTIPIGTGVGEYQPFRPMYSTSTGATADAGYSAGTECIGFTQQALSYTNNIYKHPSITHTQTWGNASPGDKYVYPNSTYGWKIWEYDSNTDFNPDEFLSFVIPGDMICMRTHAVIVNRINYNIDDRTVDSLDIDVIEAGGNFWLVNKTRNLQSLIDYNNGWYYGVDGNNFDHKITIYRLITN